MMYRTFIRSLMVACMVVTAASGASVTLYPYIAGDGTLQDSNLLDGFEVADTAAWGFNEFAPFAGALALVAPMPPDDTGFERRVFFEYDLRNVNYSVPVRARLNYRVRGAPVWPFPPVDVHVYAYIADLRADLSDYAIGPATYQGVVTVVSSIVPGQGISTGSFDVSDIVNEALNTGAVSVGFRFQIDPWTVNPQNQAFIDADDSEVTTKPALIIEDKLRFDSDDDDDVDALDYSAFLDCVKGPGGGLTLPCLDADANFDNSVDLRDFQTLQNLFTGAL